MLELSPTARRIIATLDRDARASSSSISKQLKISSDAVIYHLHNLESDGIITKYSPVIDFTKLGLQLFRVSLKLTSLAELPKRIEKLLKLQLVSIVAEVRGTHDLIIWGNAQSLNEIQAFTGTVQNIFHREYSSLSVEIITETNAYSRGYLMNRPGEVFPSRGDSQRIAVDEIELSILEVLTENARMPVSEIARKLGLTPAIVSYRIAQLEKHKVILGYRVHLNSELIGIQRFRAQIDHVTPWSSCEKAVRQFCTKNPSVTRFELQLGGWPVEIGLEVDSFATVHSVLDELREATGGAVVIRGTDLFRKTHQPKRLAWRRILESE